MNLVKNLSLLTLATVFLLSLSTLSEAQSRRRVVGLENQILVQQPEPTVIVQKEKTVSATQNPIARAQTDRSTETRTVISIPTSVFNEPKPLIKTIVSSSPRNVAPRNVAIVKNTDNEPSAFFNQRLLRAMQSRIGIPYLYGSDGPNRFDCSGLVWSVFQEAGQSITRNSAISYWESFEPVNGEERYKFGTLVFFNGLGHVGIVVDENTFYHASSSKGVSFAHFAGYWEKRIVGFRRIPLNTF